MADGFVFAQNEYDNFNIMFRGGSLPAGYEVALVSQMPVITDGPTDLVEVTGANYVRAQLGLNTTDFPTLDVDIVDGNYVVTSKQISFAGPLNAEAVAAVVLTTDTPQRLVSCQPLDVPLTLGDGYTKPITVSMKQTS
jgi:hypothetical protein